MRRELTDEQRDLLEKTQEIHRSARHAVERGRKSGGTAHRYALLAWAFVRGLDYRRVEARRRFQRVGGFIADSQGGICAETLAPPREHNAPSATKLLDVLREICTVDGAPASPFAFGTSLLGESTRKIIAETNSREAASPHGFNFEDMRAWLRPPPPDWRGILERECLRLQRSRIEAAAAE